MTATPIQKPASAEIIDIKALGEQLEMVKESSRTLNVTLTTEVLDASERFVADRPLRQAHVEHLLGEMRRGTFIDTLVTLILCEYDGVTYRMNGQHTCWAAAYYNDESEHRFRVKVQYWRAKSEHDLRRLYASIDRGSPRTKANVVHSYLVGTPQFGEFSNRQIQDIATGFSIWHWSNGHDRSHHGGEDIAYLLQTEFVALAQRVIVQYAQWRKKDHGHIMRGPVIAAMFATYNKAPRIAQDFWEVVATGIGIDSEDDARHRLRNHLMTYAVGSTPGKKSQTQEDMYRVCISAWNSFRDGKPVRLFRPSAMGSRPKAK